MKKLMRLTPFLLLLPCAAADPFAGIMYGRYAECEAAFDAAFAEARSSGKALPFRARDKRFKTANRGITPMRAGRDIKWVLGKFDELKALVDWELAATTNLVAADVYELRLSAAAAPLTGLPASIADRLAALEPELAAGVDPKERLAVIRNCASVANAACNENLVRGIALYLDRVSPPERRRLYNVRFSAHRITGPDSWNPTVLRDVVPEVQVMSRDYGGGREFFVTDVTTGDRGGGEGEMKTRPTMSVVCDDWGVHFRFVDPDEKAREIEMGLVPGGSYEAYLGPKEKPYFCFLLYPNERVMTVMNTLYDCEGHRRLDPKDPSKAWNRTVLGKEGVVTYASFSWDTWGDQIPANGTRWDFECVRWGRAGSAAWNGLKSVHGRSTWGELAFVLTDAQRAAILRRQVIRAKNDYQSEKVSAKAKTGVLDHWKDADLGDPAFHAACLAPLEAELDGYAARVTPEMTDADVFELAEKALPKWRDLAYLVARLRAAYLAERL